jgi:putative hydrolase of the HAD superfamily
MIDAILFDLGDTIINFGIGRAEAEGLFHKGARATYAYLEQRGKMMPPYRRYFRAHYRKMRNEYLWSKLVRRDFCYADVINVANSRLGIAVRPEEVPHLSWLWYQPILEASSVDAGVGEMLGHLRAAGTKLAIVSNTFVPGYCLDKHLEAEGLLEFFPVRVYSSQVRYRKPHRRIFQIALEQIGVEAQRAVFIGDLPRADIKGAKRAGMKTIWKPAQARGGGAGMSIGQAAERFDPSTAVLAAADAIIASITRLPEILPGLGWRPQPAVEAA